MTNTRSLINTIIKTLEQKGESKDYIIGFLQATMSGLAEIDSDQSVSYLQRTIEQIKA